MVDLFELFPAIVLSALFAVLLIALALAGSWLAGRAPSLGRFIRQRWSPESYLGLHLTIGIMLSFIALAMFSLIANRVVGNDELVRFDLNTARALYERATPTGVAFFTAITWLGSFPVMLMLGLAIGLVLGWREQRQLLLGWAVGLTGGSLLNLALKAVFERPRPVFDVPLAVAPGWSFPSGHAMGSLIGYGLLAYVLVRLVRRRWVRIGTLLLAPTLIVLIGFSRLYLGVHYFSDVIGGYAAGTVWLSACVSGLEIVRRRGRPSHQQHISTRHSA